MTNKQAARYPNFPVNFTPEQDITNADDELDPSSSGDQIAADEDDTNGEYDDSSARARNPHYDAVRDARTRIGGVKSCQEIH